MTNQKTSIKVLKARELLDSRGFPTVEVEVRVDCGGQMGFGRALVPSGASTGDGEALELRDGDKARYLGKGVLKAVSNANGPLAQAICKRDFESQWELDRELCALDGTPNKEKFGANAILGISMAFAKASAQAKGVSTYSYLAELFGQDGTTLPVPLMNIINGGKHADNGLSLQEFMIVPAGFSKFSDALRAGAEVFHHLKKFLHEKGRSTGVGDEGGFAPQFEPGFVHEQAMDSIMAAIAKAGYKPGVDIFLALDCASSEFYSVSEKIYTLGIPPEKKTSTQMSALYSQWVGKYPILSIEDGFAEHDWDGWIAASRELGSKVQLVGDDLFCTNKEVLQKGIDKRAGNAILIKLNQIGTVSETLDTMKLAKSAGYNSIVSHRSGETEDTFIADLAVATNCGQIKTGSASRTDRIAKYNQLLRIEEELGSKAKYLGKAAFTKG